MQLAPNLHRIGNDIVAAYLVDTDRHGHRRRPAGLWHDLNVELASMGRSRNDIRGVILTHGDSDQSGSPSGYAGTKVSRSTSTRRTPPARPPARASPTCPPGDR